jgi:hypothetical protein
VVTVGTRLGAIGEATNEGAEPHVHIELRIPDALPGGPISQAGVLIKLQNGTTNNLWGIMKLEAQQMVNLLDVVQLFNINASARISDASSQTSTQGISGLGISATNNSIVSGFTCNNAPSSLTYFANIAAMPISSPNSIRGYRLFAIVASAARDPKSQPIVSP